MKISNFQKSVIYMSIRSESFNSIVEEVCGFVKINDCNELIELSNGVRKVYEKLCTFSIYQYNDNNLNVRVMAISECLKPVEDCVISFLTENLDYSSFIVNLKILVNNSLKEVNRNLEIINKIKS